MRRKIFTVFFVLATTIETMFAVTIDGIAYILNYEKSTATVTSGVKYSGNIVIPFFVEYNDKAYTVMGIGNRAFEGCKKLTSVEIPNGVTDIGGYAFSGCDKLVIVTFGNNIYTIGERAFENCTSLTSIAIPSSVESIGDGAFYGCNGLTSITIPNSVTSIGRWAFSHCSSLTSVTIGNSVTSIGMEAFSHCSGLTSVTIPNSVTSIRDHAFFNCSSLQSVIIGSNVTSIGEDAFGGCTSLTSVNWNATNFPSLVYSISADEAPFYNIRTQITSFTFGRKVKTIPRYICYGMANLTAISIPSSVTSIGDYAFENCSGLTSVTIPNSVTSIGDYAFYSCDKLTTIVWNAKNCKAYYFGSKVESFTFGNSVEVIPDGLCSGMSKLTSIEIPDGVTSIGDGAFSGCTGLTSPVYNKRIFAYMPSSYSGAYAIPDGIESIAGSAFSDCTSLTSIEIPKSVTSIGSVAFYGCNNLKSVNISDIAAWCNISFSGYDANPLYYAHDLYFNGELVTSLKIPDGTTQVGIYAFYGYTGLASVEIPSSVTSIGDWAFDGCSGLTSVTIPNSVTSIGRWAFSHCSSLTSVTIGNSVTSIRESAFYDCTGLTSIEIPNSVTSIGIEAFRFCTGLTSVTIPNSVTSIGEHAFAYCSGLTSVTIPNSVTSIGTGTFYGCSGLISVTCFATTPPQLDSYVFARVDKSIPLYVPAGSISAYKSADQWKDFTNILPIGAQPADVTITIVTPSATTANITWPQVTGAATYTIEIKKNGELICTLTFNAQGQLISIALAAPSRNNAPQQAQAAGFSFTVTSLDSGTTYSYTMTAKGNNGNVLKTESGSFTTTGDAQGVEEVLSNQVPSTKILRNGQIFILRGDKIYNAQGALVK